MNKAIIIKTIANKTYLPQSIVQTVVETFMTLIGDVLVNNQVSKYGKNDVFQYTGFGTFRLHTRSQRNGSNPHTKEAVIIPEKKVISFRAGSKLKCIVNDEINGDKAK